MQFWQRVRTAIKNNNTTQEWVSSKIPVSLNTFKGWIAKEIMPNADQALAIAKVLNLTVEELVDGDAGRSYVFDWAAQHGGNFQAPPRISDLVDALMQAPDEALDLLRPSILAAAAPRRSQSKLA
jgi:DNA-binding XRE family transcriptional regulator